MCIQEYRKFKRNKDRLLPHDLNAEEVVLNYLLMNKKSLIINNLQPHEFYNEINKILFEVMLELYNQEQSINQVTIANKLFDQNITVKRDYIKSLSNDEQRNPNSKVVDTYKRSVKRKRDENDSDFEIIDPYDRDNKRRGDANASGLEIKDPHDRIEKKRKSEIEKKNG